MQKFFLTLIFGAGLAASAVAQVGGQVVDRESGAGVSAATVALVRILDSAALGTTVTDSNGRFNFNTTGTGRFIVRINALDYQESVTVANTTDSAEADLYITMARQGKDLSGVTVIASAPAVLQKGDTAQFSASQYKVNPDATTEDLIKKMPGITVARDGTVTAQGEQVRKVTIDGKDFFGDDASAALKNLPSEVVDKIQVFDRLSDQAQLTGFDDGNSVKALNIVTKSGVKNGQFGRVYAGYGTDERYSAGGNVSFFKGDRRLSLVGNFNNINQQNFASQDLLGLTSSGGRGGQQGGGGFQRGGNSDNFTTGQASGVSNTNALGINFGNVYNKKLTLSASYFYNNSTNNNSAKVFSEIFGDSAIFQNQESEAVTRNTNHRISGRLEYKIDSNNTLILIPNINLQESDFNTRTRVGSIYETLDSLSSSLTNILSDRNGYNIRNTIQFRHSFPSKRGRSISFNFNTAFTKNNAETFNTGNYRFYKPIIDSVQDQFTDSRTKGRTIGGNIAYTEPIGKKAQIQIDYSPSVQKNFADQNVFNNDGGKYTEFEQKLSNKFENTITTNNAGISYRYNESRDAGFMFGANVQNARLLSERELPTATRVDQTFTNILPNAMYRKKISASSSIRLFYRASVNFPTVTQLQDVVNLTSPLRASVGNPQLDQSYTHFLNARYTYTNSKTSRSFFANIFAQTASDYITNAIFLVRTGDSAIQQNNVIKRGGQLTKPVNLDGYRNLRTFLTYSTPIKAIKTNINLSTGFGYNKLPGLYNNIETTTDNITYNAGVVFASNINEFVDFNLGYNANFTNTKTRGGSTADNNYVNQTASVQFNLLSKKGWFIQNDINAQFYSGLAEGLNNAYGLWNAGIGKKFLKNRAGELKLSVFDLLAQNQAITRTVTSFAIEDSQTEVLERYFLLTFTYNLKNFGVAARASAEREGERQGPGGTPRF